MAEFTNITFRVRTTHLQRMIDAHSTYFGYRPADVDGNQNPETESAYVKRKIWEQWVNRTMSYEISQMVKPDPIDGGEI